MVVAGRVHHRVGGKAQELVRRQDFYIIWVVGKDTAVGPGCFAGGVFLYREAQGKGGKKGVVQNKGRPCLQNLGMGFGFFIAFFTCQTRSSQLFLAHWVNVGVWARVLSFRMASRIRRTPNSAGSLDAN